MAWRGIIDGVRGLDSPWGLRVTGLVGVAVVAAGAYGAGALPGRDPGIGLRGPGTPGAGFWFGLAAWVVGLAILSGAWWRLGSRLGEVSGRWLITTAALWALPLLLAPPLASRDVYSYACQGAIWHSGLDPYAGGAADGGCPWSGAVPDLWQHTPAPYGPVAIALSGAAAAIARAVGGPADHQLLAAVTVLRIVALAGGVLIAAYAGRLAGAVGIRPQSARWLGLLSPLVAVHLVSGAHNDALTAGLTVAALAVAVPAAARGGSAAPLPAPSGLHPPGSATGPTATGADDQLREIGDRSPQRDSADGPRTTSDPPTTTTAKGSEFAHATGPDTTGRQPPWASAVAAGVFLGLAAGVKITAIIALPFVVLLVAGWRLRPGTPPRATIALAAVTVTGTGAAVFAAASLASGLDLGWVGALSDTGSLVQWTSLPTGIGMAAGYLLRAAGWPDAVDTAVDVARLCGIAALALIGVRLCWRALRATLRLGLDHPAFTPDGMPVTVAASTDGRSGDERVGRQPVADVAHGRDLSTGTAEREAERRREIVAACGWALVAAAVLLPVFYPWYALVPLAVLACATPPGRTRTVLAATAIALTALVLPNGLGLAVLTKLPGAILDVAIVAALGVAVAYRFRRCRSNQDDPVPAVGPR